MTETVVVVSELETETIEVGYAQPAGNALQLSGDLGGSTGAIHVLSTHLTSPLPITQGGTGAGSGSGALTALGGVPAAGGTMSRPLVLRGGPPPPGTSGERRVGE